MDPRLVFSRCAADPRMSADIFFVQENLFGLGDFFFDPARLQPHPTIENLGITDEHDRRAEAAGDGAIRRWLDLPRFDPDLHGSRRRHTAKLTKLATTMIADTKINATTFI